MTEQATQERPASARQEVDFFFGEDEEEDNEEDEYLVVEEANPLRLEAKKRFTRRHEQYHGGAHAFLAQLEGRPTDRVVTRGFEQALAEVRRNRFFVDMPPQPPPSRVKPRFKPRKKWSLFDSVWLPRRKRSPAGSFWECDETIETCFNQDWTLARSGHGLSRFIVKRQGKVGGGEGWIDDNGNGVHDEVDQTREVLASNYRLLLGVFEYYCCIFDNGKSEHNEVDVYTMGFNAFLQFARDCSLANLAVPMRVLEVIWHEVNALDPALAALDRFNKARSFVRHEFLQAVVRIAIARFVDTGQVPDVSDSVQALCDLIRQGVPIEAKQNSNLFRTKHCYHVHTDRVLQREWINLKAIFDTYAKTNTDLSDTLQSSSMLSIGEWMRFLGDVGLLQSGQISVFGAKMAFMWSRVRMQRNITDRSEMRLRSLHFEDFLEAFVRVATIIALPTDHELEESGAADAYEYLKAISGDMGAKSRKLEAYVQEYKSGWLNEPRQGAFRCVHHFANFMVRTIEGNTSRSLHGQADMKTTAGELAEFERRRRNGVLLQQVSAASSLLDGVRAAEAIVRQRLLDGLQRVDVFNKLNFEQLELLGSKMTACPFSEGEYVFEQGEEGDTFYVIVEGCAHALRQESEEQEEQVIGELGEGAYFGERALLKKQVRYAGVKAVSGKLHTMCISRRVFEAHLGPLSELVPDKYVLDDKEIARILSGMNIFANLEPAQLSALVAAMSKKEVREGEYVLKQGEMGDAFYVMTDGEAAVLRTEEGQEGETVLARLCRASYFGERALLKAEPRSASVRAASKVDVLFITRKRFEATIGTPLSDLIPLSYSL